MMASEVYEQSKKPITIIQKLENHFWNGEVERLVDRVWFDYVALSGMKFFSMTRRLLFGVSCDASNEETSPYIIFFFSDVWINYNV